MDNYQVNSMYVHHSNILYCVIIRILMRDDITIETHYVSTSIIIKASIVSDVKSWQNGSTELRENLLLEYVSYVR